MYNDDQPRDEQGKWTSDGSSEADSVKSKNYIELPKKEYAEFCSAIRTRYANKIPAKGQIFHGVNYYRFNYNRAQEKIACTLKIEIIGNEDRINRYWEAFDNE